MSYRQILGSVCVLGLATFLAFCIYQPAVGINESGYGAIREGMTRHGVEEVFGRPPGDYTVKKRVRSYFSPGTANAASYLGWSWEEWISDEGWVTLTFDRDGKVIDKYFRAVDDLPDSSLAEAVESFCRKAFRW